MNTDTTFNLEQRILHFLILNTSFIKDVGLMSGKTGILLALVEYNKRLYNKIYGDFIEELIDDIWEQIHKELSIGFSDGLSGIGWGVEFLIHHKIIDGTGMELCIEIDREIMGTDPRRIVDMGLDNGLEGLLFYILAHIRNAMLQKQIPFDTTYHKDLFHYLNAIKKSGTKRLDCFIYQYLDFYVNRKIPEVEFSLKPFVTNFTTEYFLPGITPLGLREGLAGLLVKNI